MISLAIFFGVIVVGCACIAIFFFGASWGTRASIKRIQVYFRQHYELGHNHGSRLQSMLDSMPLDAAFDAFEKAKLSHPGWEFQHCSLSRAETISEILNEKA